MYAEPMGSKTPTRSPQSALHLDPHAAPNAAEEVLHTPRHVPGTLLLLHTDCHSKHVVSAHYLPTVTQSACPLHSL